MPPPQNNSQTGVNVAGSKPAVPTTGITGFNPITSSAQPSGSGFTSSAQPIINQQMNTGVANGMNSVNGGTSPTSGQNPSGQNPSGQNQPSPQQGGAPQQPVDPVTAAFQQYSGQVANVLQSTTANSTNAASNVYNATIQNAQLANQSIGLQYNTALGNLNTQYQQSFQQLQQQHAQSVGSATAAIAAADPLGMQGGSFASSYVGKINDLYSQQATFMNNAYSQQQTSLANGDMQASLGIQQQINTAQANFGQQLAQIQSGAMSTVLQMGQTALGVAQFEYSKQQQSLSMGTSAANTFMLPATQLQGAGLVTPITQNGITTGYNMNSQLVSALGAAATDKTAFSKLSPQQQGVLTTIMQDPTYQDLVAGGASPATAVQAAAMGSYRNLSTQVQSASQALWAGSVAKTTGATLGGQNPTTVAPVTSYTSTTSGGRNLDTNGLSEMQGINTAFDPATMSNVQTAVNAINNGTQTNMGGVISGLIAKTGINAGDILSKISLTSPAIVGITSAINDGGDATKALNDALSSGTLNVTDQKAILAEILNESVANTNSFVSSYGSQGFNITGLGDITSKLNKVNDIISSLGGQTGSSSSGSTGGSSGSFGSLPPMSSLFPSLSGMKF